MSPNNLPAYVSFSTVSRGIAGHDHQKLELMDREQHLQCDDPGHGNAPGRTVPHGLQELAGAIILETKGLLAGTIPNELRVPI